MISGEFLTYTLIFIIIVILIEKLFEYKKKLKNESLKLVQFYLDKKFINKLVVNSLKSQQLKLEFIENIKEYFQLDDIIIMKSADLEKDDPIANLFRKKTKEAISAHYNQSDIKSKDSYIILDSVETANSSHRLYIYFSTEKVSQKHQESIICIKKKPSYLSKDEIFTLDTSIHILRIFLSTYN